jgi:hypothetical protein
MFKKKVADPELEIQSAKESFLELLTKRNGLSEFREVLALSEKYHKLCTPLFSFLENYLMLQKLFKSDFNLKDDFNMNNLILTEPVVSRFRNPYIQKPQKKFIKVPDNVIHQLLRFYATFISISAPFEIIWISDEIRDNVAAQLLDIARDKFISTDLFDSAADIVLDAIFSRCYKKQMKIKGTSLPIMKQVIQNHKQWEEFVMNEPCRRHFNSQDQNEMRKKKSEGFRIQDFKWSNSRECMVLSLQIPALYDHFSKYIKETHCEENLMFVESFLKLESRTTKSNEPLCLNRFLGVDVEDEMGERIVPISLAPLYLFFHRMFIIPDSPFEVNVSHSLRKDIEKQIVVIKEKMIRTTIYDTAVDHVLNLLYQNSFVSFIKTK